MKTLKIRIKDKHSRELVELSKKVSFVFNYINDLSYRNIKERQKWLSTFDISTQYLSGSSKELGLNSQTIQQVSKEYVTRRNQLKKSKLRFRSTYKTKRSLGWIPFTGQGIKYKNGQIIYSGTYYSLWDSYGLSQYDLRSGCFSEDSRGRWYLCVCVKEKEAKPLTNIDNKIEIGIDLGLKEVAITSQGDKLVSGHYRNLEDKLAKAQRAKKKKSIKNISAKIRNQRLDSQHKFSRRLVDMAKLIVVGDVSTKYIVNKLGKGGNKSIYDASWFQLKTMLRYKSSNAGVVFLEINESFTTMMCSSCYGLTGPTGRSGLSIRTWKCEECNTLHDRDINASINILNKGKASLADS